MQFGRYESLHAFALFRYEADVEDHAASEN